MTKPKQLGYQENTKYRTIIVKAQDYNSNNLNLARKNVHNAIEELREELSYVKRYSFDSNVTHEINNMDKVLQHLQQKPLDSKALESLKQMSATAQNSSSIVLKQRAGQLNAITQHIGILTNIFFLILINILLYQAVKEFEYEGWFALLLMPLLIAFEHKGELALLLIPLLMILSNKVSDGIVSQLQKIAKELSRNLTITSNVTILDNAIKQLDGDVNFFPTHKKSSSDLYVGRTLESSLQQ